MARLSVVNDLAAAVRDLVFPRVCAMCGRTLVRGEEAICLHCRSELPLTDMHRMARSTVEEKMAGTLPLEHVVAYCYYDRGAPYARLVQHAKYHGRPSLLRWLARRYATILQAEGFFDEIDGVLPVPMHFLKQMRRGYNQAEWIARGVSDVTGLPVMDNLRAVRGHSSQTRRGSFARWENAQALYETVRPGELDGRHLLLVDDVITTGATILACVGCLHQASPTARFSALAVASARMS